MTRWKRLITADPTDADFVYAVWDRVQAAAPDDPATPFSGDTLFARSTDGGETWEPAQTILDVPDNSNIQSLGNQIVVLGDGMFVNVFNLIAEGTPIVAVQRSTDKGATWSEPIAIDVLLSSAVTTQGGVVDPSDGHSPCGPAISSPTRRPTRDRAPAPSTSSGRTCASRCSSPSRTTRSSPPPAAAASPGPTPGAPAPTAASSRSRDRCTSTATARSASRTTTSPTTTRAAGRSTPTRGSPPHRSAD